MQTNSHHLEPEHLSAIDGLTAAIVKAINPEKIILYAILPTKQRHWHAATGWQQFRDQLNCYLLVIPDVTDQRTDDMLRNLLQEIVLPDITAHYTVNKRQRIGYAFDSGSRFFITICTQGMLIHDNGQPLVMPQPITAQEYLIDAKQEWSAGYLRAISFYNGAAYYQQTNNSEQVVFCLHQCVEQLTMALSKALTGYSPSTHQLHKLLSLLRLAGVNTTIIFPCNTPTEVALVEVLSAAYTASRYSRNFIVAPETAAVLMER